MPLLILFTAIATLLGATRPRWGVITFVSAIAVSSGIAWRLGLGNLWIPGAFVVGLLFGSISYYLGSSKGGATFTVPPVLRIPASLLIAAVGACTTIALARVLHLGDDIWAAELWRSIGDLSVYGQSRAWAQVRGLLVAAMGPSVFLVGIATFTDASRAVKLLRRAFLVALFVDLCSVPLLHALSDPWARPDRGTGGWVGLSGFFQDPHSRASFLLLVLGLAGGLAYSAFRAGRWRTLLGYLGLCATATALLFGTNSRGGFVAFLATLGTLILVLLVPRTGLGESFRLRLAAAGGIVFVTLLAFVFVGAVPETLELLRFLEQATTETPTSTEWSWPPDLTGARSSVAFRLALVAKSLRIVSQYPLWGVGGGGYYDYPAPVPAPLTAHVLAEELLENAHNNYLQIAAEFGVPSLVCFLWLNFAVAAFIAKRWKRAAEPTARGTMLGVLAGQIGFLVIGFFSHPLLLPEIQGLYGAFLALGVVTAASTDSPEEDQRT